MKISRTDEVLELSRRMLAAADRQDWESVHELEAQRTRLFEQYDAREQARSGKQAIESALREMLDINQRILELSLNARDELQKHFGTLNRGIKAEEAYRRNE